MSALNQSTTPLLEPRCYPTRLSLVIPVYNEDASIPLLQAAITRFARDVQSQLEVIVVNDGSTDHSLAKLIEWVREDRSITVLHLSRNFGHQSAATAGLDRATGDAVVLIDADLQDPLAVIHDMIAQYQAGYDVVYGQRLRRQGESKFKLVTAWLFYRLMRGLVYDALPVDTGDFRLISRRCLDALKALRETHRFLRGMVAWVGYPQTAVRYERSPRVAGTTKYPISKMLSFAWTAATSFSTLPLKFNLVFGGLAGLLAVEEAIRALLAYALGWYQVPGWTSLVVITSAIGSAVLIGVGLVGEYVGKIYEQSKQRPIYLVARTFGGQMNNHYSEAEYAKAGSAE